MSDDIRWPSRVLPSRRGAVMITFVEGVLEEVLPSQIVVNAGGIGYQILIPSRATTSSPNWEPVSVS